MASPIAQGISANVFIAVSYTISQIGDDQNSKAFLAGLKNNPVPDNVLYVTSGE